MIFSPLMLIISNLNFRNKYVEHQIFCHQRCCVTKNIFHSQTFGQLDAFYFVFWLVIRHLNIQIWMKLPEILSRKIFKLVFVQLNPDESQKITVVTQILLTSLAPSSYWERAPEMSTIFELQWLLSRIRFVWNSKS